MNQRIKLTKRLFHESLIRLLKEKTIDEISVKELCENAEINRSTFYSHYTCVRDVIVEIEHEITDEVKKVCKEENIDFKGKLEKICDILYKEKETEIILFKNHTDNELSEALSYLDNEIKNLRGIAKSKEDEILISAFINYGMFNLIKTWLTNDINRTPKEISSLLVDKVLKPM